MVTLDESVAAGQVDHVADHDEIHRLLNRILVITSGSSADAPNIVIGEDNAAATDIGAATISGGGTPGRENIVGGDGSSTVGTSNANVVATGTGADYGVIGGGYDNMVGGLASVVTGLHNYSGLTVTHATISGGSTNSITSDDYGTIAGGHINTVSADEATISGGSTNTATGLLSTVGGGKQNDATGAHTTIAGGNTNVASGLAATIPGGLGNTAAGDYSLVAGRASETTTAGDYATAFGREASATIPTSLVLAGQKITTVGDAQTATIVVSKQTTTVSTTQMLVNGSSKLTIPSDTTWAFRALIVARRTDADDESAAYEIVGCIDNNAGTTALVGAPTTTVLAEDSSAWNVVAARDDTNDALLFNVTGENSKTINWVGRVDLAQVTG